MKFSAERLVEARKSAGLTQNQLAERIGAIQQMVYKWESGKNSPSGDNLKALADALAKPTEWFFVSPPTALKHSAQLAPSKAKSVREVRRRLTVARDQLVVSQGQALEQGQTELAKALLGVQREVLAALDELDKLTGDS